MWSWLTQRGPNQILSRLATIGASSADISTQQVLVMFGALINMISGVLVLVYGFIIVLTHLLASTTGWRFGGQTKILASLLPIILKQFKNMVVSWLFPLFYNTLLLHFLSTAIPLVCQSDPGGENNTIANIHTLAWHELNPSLVGTLQHWWKHNKTNVKSEATWSVFHWDFAPGYKDLFESGVNQGWYDVTKLIEKYVVFFSQYHWNIPYRWHPHLSLVFWWLAIPWL